MEAFLYLSINMKIKGIIDQKATMKDVENERGEHYLIQQCVLAQPIEIQQLVE